MIKITSAAQARALFPSPLQKPCRTQVPPSCSRCGGNGMVQVFGKTSGDPKWKRCKACKRSKR